MTVIVAVAKPLLRPAPVALVARLDLEAEGGRWAEEVRVRCEFQSRVTFSKGNEIAVVDRSSSIVLEKCAIGNPRDLEVRHFRAIDRVSTNNQAGGCLRVLVGRGICDRRGIRDGVDRDRRGSETTA